MKIILTILLIACGSRTPYVVLRVTQPEAMLAIQETADAINTAFGYISVSITDEPTEGSIEVIISQTEIEKCIDVKVKAVGLWDSENNRIITMPYYNCDKYNQPCVVIGTTEAVASSSWGDRTMFQDTLIHEIGHVIGLNHIPNTIMSETRGAAIKVDIAAYSLSSLFQPIIPE